MATFAGVVYIAFVVNTFSRRIVGWSAATTKETRLVPDALETALRQRDRDGRRPCQTSWYPTAVQEVRGDSTSTRHSAWLSTSTPAASRRRSDSSATPVPTPAGERMGGPGV
ncbi:hypothetical protein OG618_36580 [Kitasatospora sp. NBC_01246]|uniref:hypothetical protein n=1 Tax=Kitasatospora sp. NBC_01246 TaxID=2903570 RepID=UPI002E32B39D|nr:hypothetical protein [Kitasatospora sp. NBC_01246]